MTENLTLTSVEREAQAHLADATRALERAGSTLFQRAHVLDRSSAHDKQMLRVRWIASELSEIRQRVPSEMARIESVNGVAQRPFVPPVPLR